MDVGMYPTLSMDNLAVWSLEICMMNIPAAEGRTARGVGVFSALDMGE